jgi:hypothetical protein
VPRGRPRTPIGLRHVRVPCPGGGSAPVPGRTPAVSSQRRGCRRPVGGGPGGRARRQRRDQRVGVDTAALVSMSLMASGAFSCTLVQLLDSFLLSHDFSRAVIVLAFEFLDNLILGQSQPCFRDADVLEVLGGGCFQFSYRYVELLAACLVVLSAEEVEVGASSCRCSCGLQHGLRTRHAGADAVADAVRSFLALALAQPGTATSVSVGVVLGAVAEQYRACPNFRQSRQAGGAVRVRRQ